MTRVASGLEIGGFESEVGTGLKRVEVVDFGREGEVTDFADRVEGEIDEAGDFPSTGVVEGLIGMVARTADRSGDSGRSKNGSCGDAWSLVFGAPAALDQDGTAGVGTRTHRI